MRKYILSVIFSLILSIAPLSHTEAVSSYDNTIHTTDELHVSHTQGSQTIWSSGDISKNYIDTINRECNDRFSNMVDSFHRGMSNGHFATIQWNQYWSHSVIVYWTEKENVDGMEFYTDSNDNTWLSLPPQNIDGIIELAYTRDHTIGCSASKETGVYYNTLTGPSQVTPKLLYANTYPTIYPAGYQGEQIFDLAVRHGVIDCGNDPVEYFTVIQDGKTHSVPLNYTSDYGANWSYVLSSNPYYIIAGCGDTVAASYSAVRPLTSSNSWICNTIDNPPYCVLM